MHLLSRFRRPSIFAAARAVVFLTAPVPIVQWWYNDGHRPVLQWYYYQASEPASKAPLGNSRAEQDLSFSAQTLMLQRDSVYVQILIWYSRNRPLSLPTCCVIAQTLGVVGAAGALLQSRRRRRGHCPACDYSLQGLTPDSRGQLRCPECGADGIKVRPARTTSAAQSPHPLPPL